MRRKGSRPAPGRLPRAGRGGRGFRGEKLLRRSGARPVVRAVIERKHLAVLESLHLACHLFRTELARVPPRAALRRALHCQPHRRNRRSPQDLSRTRRREGTPACELGVCCGSQGSHRARGSRARCCHRCASAESPACPWRPSKQPGCRQAHLSTTLCPEFGALRSKPGAMRGYLETGERPQEPTVRMVCGLDLLARLSLGRLLPARRRGLPFAISGLRPAALFPGGFHAAASQRRSSICEATGYAGHKDANQKEAKTANEP